MKPRANSNFHMIVNSNISRNQMTAMTREERLELLRIFTDSVKFFKENIHTFLKDGNSSMKLTQSSFNYEIGKVKNGLHIDGWMRFDCYCQFNFRKVTDHFNRSLSKYSKGVHLDIKYIHDNIAAVQNYSQKDGHSLVT